MNWTPGPWKVRTIDGSMGTIETADGELQIGQTFQLRGNDRTTGHAERLANTALIAATPELYEALAAFCNTYVADVPVDHRDYHLVQKARAALAKARGEV